VLADTDIAAFETFGFLAMRSAFTDEEMAQIESMFDEVLAQDRGTAEFNGQHRQAVTGFIERRAELSKLVADDRIYTAIEALLGPGFTWIGSDGNLYVGDTEWHPDNSADYRRIKVAFYLDPVTRDTGCLRVIPGSQMPCLHDELKARLPGGSAAAPAFGLAGSDIPSHPIESRPGDVVLFNQNLWHAAYGGRVGRRMFTLNFGAKPTEESDFAHLRAVYERNLQFVQELQHEQVGRIYTDEFLQNDSPRIQSMVAPIRAMGLR
jgi:Phytanoyl-CoA dioxygenase (PhyH)